MLGGLTAAAPIFVPDVPRKAGVPLAVRAWVNADAFGVLAFRPELKEHAVYKAGVAGSFMAASWGFVGLAVVAWKRWRNDERDYRPDAARAPRCDRRGRDCRGPSLTVGTDPCTMKPRAGRGTASSSERARPA